MGDENCPRCGAKIAQEWPDRQRRYACESEHVFGVEAGVLVFAEGRPCLRRQLAQKEAKIKERDGAATILTQIADRLKELTGQQNVWRAIEQLQAENKRLREAYVPQEVAADCLKFLQEAGYGTPGRPNTLWAMTHEVCCEVKRLRAILDKLGVASGWLRVERRKTDIHDIWFVERAYVSWSQYMGGYSTREAAEAAARAALEAPDQ